MVSPKEVIESIREIRFGIGFDEGNLSAKQKARSTDMKTILKHASRLTKDINSKKPYFIFELIQNADDNTYESVEATIRFIIGGGKLIIQNNEKGFYEENVWALCGIGETTKTKALGYIGEKGIGFKSVFMVTDEPHIYSNNFQFKFEYSSDNPSSIITPIWVDSVPDFIDLAQTNILLHLKDKEESEISQDTRDIDPSLLLFLRKLKVIEIEDKIQDRYEKIKRYDHNGKVEIVHRGGKDYWRVIKKKLEVPDHIEEEKRKDVHETELILAFPLEEDETANTSNKQWVFAFLPIIHKYGFKFIIHADFLLTVSREDIIEDKRWNGWLRDSIAAVFLDAVEEFKADKNLRYTFYDYLNFEDVSDDFLSPATDQIYESLRDMECILTETNLWKKPSDVLRGDEEIKELVPNEALKNFFGKEYISSEIKAKESILRKLDVKKFSNEDLIKCLEYTEWVEKQSDDWFALLYEYLSKQGLSNSLLGQLKGLDIIRLENGELTSGQEKAVFRSIDKKGKEYGFEKKLRIAKRTIIELIAKREKQEKDLKILEFVENLGIRPSDPSEIIKTHILPIYESDEWKQEDAATLLGHIRYIKENMTASWTPLWDRLKNSLRIRIDKTAEEKYEHMHSIYLSKIYGNENDLETLFDGINVCFVHPCYIEDALREYDEKRKSSEKSKKVRRKYKSDVKRKQLKKIKEEKNNKIKEWKEFFCEMGMNDIPKVEAKEEIRKHITKLYEYRQTVKIYRSPDICDILERKNLEKNKKLLTILDQHWEHYNNFVEWTDYYFHYGWQPRKNESDWFRDISETNWLPAIQNALVKASEAFLDKPEIREVLGDNVPYLTAEIKNEDFIKAIDINAEANVEGVLNYLKVLVEQECDDKNKFEKLYNFLNNNYKYKINDVFKSHPLIYVPNTAKKFFTSHEVLWQDVSDIFGENRGYLEEHYHDLRDFFVEKISVSEKPSPKDYADVLVDLSQKDVIADEDEQIILKIYKELNYHLNPDAQEPIYREDWWDDFIGKPIFFIGSEKFYYNKENVFINDSQELYNLFKNEVNIAFLWLPHDYHPDKIKFFIEAARLRYLSEAEITPNFGGGSYLNESHTAQVRNSMPYIIRYLYWNEHIKYESLKKNGVFEEIINLEVCSVDELQVKYTVQIHSSMPTTSVTCTADAQHCLLHNNKLYIPKEPEIDMDHAAIELSKIFGEIKGLDDFIISIFEKQTEAKIKNLMDAKRIPELPDSERVFFEGFSQTKTEMDATKPDETSSEETHRDTHEPESAEVVSERNTKDPLKPTKGGGGSADVGEQWDPVIAATDAPTNVERYIGQDPRPPKLPIGAPKPAQTERGGSDIPHDAVKIGKWGEEYALECLKKEKCEKYLDGEISGTQEGFIIKKDGGNIVEVKWLNKSNEQQKSYDIELIENDTTHYIEVKSTKTEKMDWFDVSKGQWELMQEKGDKFWIYRVSSTGTKKVKLVKIENPAKLWRDGGIVAHPIRIQI